MALWTVFVTVFLAELGDKTQLATLLFAADQRNSPIGIFVAASCALIFSSLFAVLLGGQISHYLSPRPLEIVAGISFILIGIWILVGVGR